MCATCLDLNDDGDDAWRDGYKIWGMSSDDGVLNDPISHDVYIYIYL